jgi:hypothetical protein
MWHKDVFLYLSAKIFEETSLMTKATPEHNFSHHNSTIMKYTITVAALAAVATAQKLGGTPSKNCMKLADIKSLPDPFTQLPPEKATFPCDMGGAIPMDASKIPSGCAKLEIIVARGTSEPGDFGMIIGDPLVARVKRDLPGVAVQGYPVQYPASTTGSNKGVEDVEKRVRESSVKCPDQKYVLVGYSQGGMVVLQALPKIAAYNDKIAAIVLYGATDGTGVLSEANKKKALANCAPGDFACSNAGKGAGHVSYNNQGTKWHDKASQFIVSAYNGKPQGLKVERDPN